MTPWHVKRIHCFPQSVGIIMAVGMAIVFAIAVVRKDVSPYVPFISETGAYHPEAGIFSLFLDVTATVGVSTIILRYMIVEECNQSRHKSVTVINCIALAIGILSMFGMITVAAYPMITIPSAHSIGALVLFTGSMIYGYFHTWISYKMYPAINSKRICITRLILVIISTIAYFTTTVVMPYARKSWGETTHDHWTGRKTPTDEGFTLLVVSATAEWVMAFSFIGYFFTFIKEFTKVGVHLDVRMLVSHFDDEIPPRETTENTNNEM